MILVHDNRVAALDLPRPGIQAVARVAAVGDADIDDMKVDVVLLPGAPRVSSGTSTAVAA